MYQKFQKNAVNVNEENFQDPLVKLMSQERDEKTGIEKVKELIEFEYFDEAIMSCNTVLSVNKKDFPHMIQKFCAYVKACKFDNENILPLIMELEKSYPQCLKDVEYAEAKYDYYLNTNSYAKAEEFQSVLKQIYGEKNSKYDAAIAQLHIKRGKYNDALEIIDRGLSQNEFDGLLYELKGDIFQYQFNRYEDALVQYKYSMQMNKRNPALFEKMSTILYNKNFYEETVQYATVTLEQIRSAKDKNHLTQQQRHCILLRGSSYIYLKSFEEAQNNFQRILDFDEKCIQSRMGKAYACMYKGKSDQAVAIFKKGEELNASYPDYGSYMALAYFLRKDYDNCEIQLKKYFKKFNQNSEGQTQQQPKNIFNLLNYVNFFYLDESYAKASMEKVFSTLDISTFKLSDIDLHFIENLSTYEPIKKYILEYLQNLMLYLATGLYRWYPEDLYAFLQKHRDNQEVSQKISHIYSMIDKNKQTAKKSYQQRIQQYSDQLNNQQGYSQIQTEQKPNNQESLTTQNVIPDDNPKRGIESQVTLQNQQGQIVNNKSNLLSQQIIKTEDNLNQQRNQQLSDRLKNQQEQYQFQNEERTNNQDTLAKSKVLLGGNPKVNIESQVTKQNQQGQVVNNKSNQPSQQITKREDSKGNKQIDVTKSNEHKKNQKDQKADKKKNEKDCSMKQNQNENKKITEQKQNVQKEVLQSNQVKIQPKTGLKNNQLDNQNIEQKEKNNSQHKSQPVDGKKQDLQLSDQAVQQDTQRQEQYQLDFINVKQTSQQVSNNQSSDINKIKLSQDNQENKDITNQSSLIQKNKSNQSADVIDIAAIEDNSKKEQINCEINYVKPCQDSEKNEMKANEKEQDYSDGQQQKSNEFSSVKDQQQIIQNQINYYQEKPVASVKQSGENFDHSKLQNNKQIKEETVFKKVNFAEQNSSQMIFSQNYFSDAIQEQKPSQQGKEEFQNVSFNQETSKELNLPQQLQSENQSVMKNNNQSQTPQQVNESSCCSIF